ncbi:hypothetical protein DFS34DRAFT_111900 [Phlyctochytrium arcticum]|nr:hypothetical protein DFS34DRAFT_111900 [Phlyctochytrium arcticum]
MSNVEATFEPSLLPSTAHIQVPETLAPLNVGPDEPSTKQLGAFPLQAPALAEEEEQLLRATERNLTNEYNYAVAQQREHAGEQSKLQFRLDSLTAKKNTYQRAIRQLKQEMRDLADRLRKLLTWHANDAKIAFEKERDRNMILMNRAGQLSEWHETLHRATQQKLHARKDSAEKLAMERNKLRIESESVQEKLSMSLHELGAAKSQAEAEARGLEGRKIRRDTLIMQRLELEETTRKRELELLLSSLRKQRQSDEADAAGLLELESLELSETALKRIPNLELAPKIRHVKLDHNQLSDLKGLENLKDLRTLSVQSNHYATLDLTWFSELRTLLAGNNDLTHIMHLDNCTHLQVLDLSSNPLRNLHFLASSAALQVLILRNTQINDLSPLTQLRSLIYIDAAQNGIHSALLDGISSSKTLQFLDLSENVLNEVPRIPNNMVLELKLHHNNIRNLTIRKWCPLLRSIDLSDNHLKFIEPLAVTPLLQEINIANNLIADYKSLYALAVCPDLRKLNLLDNPIILDRHFHTAVGVLFPHIQEINGESAAQIARKGKRRHYSKCKPVAILKWSSACWKYLKTCIDEEQECHENDAVCLSDFRRVALAQERNIETFMGPFFHPSLQYLYHPLSIVDDEDTRVVLRLQERRITWLASILQQNLSEIEILLRKHTPTPNMAIVEAMTTLESRVQESSVCIVQGLWRGRIVRRAKRKRNGAARLIQNSWRKYLERIEEIRKARELLERQVTAVVCIQRHWRGYAVRRRIKSRLLAKMNRKLSQSTPVDPRRSSLTVKLPTAKPALTLPLLEDEDTDEDMDAWLRQTSSKDFDAELDTYLSDDRLVHFAPGSGSSKRSQVPTQEEEEREPLTENEQRMENLLQIHLEAFNASASKLVNPKDPIHMLLINRGMIRAQSPGRTAFSEIDQPHVSRVSSPRAKDAPGLTASMLLSRRSPDRLTDETYDRTMDKSATLGTRVTLPGQARKSQQFNGLDDSAIHVSDGPTDEDHNWNLSSDLTKALLQRKVDRDAKLLSQAQLRKTMKDPMVRLKAIQSASRGASGNRKPAETVYQWDLMTPKDLRPRHLPPVSQRHPPKAAAARGAHEHDPNWQEGEDQGRVLLVNNYVRKLVSPAAP